MKLLKDILIDYDALAKACEFYSKLGYKQIEVPWFVSQRAAFSTAPNGRRGCAYATDGGEYLVCSAEQGFIQKLWDDELEYNTQYFSVSPCFRNESHSPYHSNTFMKLELFHATRDQGLASKVADSFASDALLLMRKHPKFMADVDMVDTCSGVDIVDADGLELGSYGVRSINLDYISYGTGLALPRITIAKKRNGISYQ